MSLPTLKNYRVLEKIGSGSYATVYKAVRKDDCNREVMAIKRVDKSRLSSSAVNNLLTEIDLLKILKHDHIVEMRDFFYEDGCIYIVMEYCNAGDLSSFIRKRHKLPEQICRRCLQQLASALKYLRDHNVCHMDLKPQNLLLTRRPRLTLKVGDFGFAQYLSNSEQKLTMRGTPLYMAPEMLLNHKYDARVDLWSVGVIMYECLFGEAPYLGTSLQELTKKIKEKRPIELPKGSQVSAECKDLLQSLLKHDPDERISFDDFFKHEFLDLDHAPTKENYEKAVELVQQAIKMDMEKNPKEAFHLYCEALRYFIPQLTNEVDPKRKEVLRMYVNDYIKRAETLKASWIDKKTECKEKTTSDRTQSSNDAVIGTVSPELRSLSKATPGMADALEIGEVAELYLMEGNYGQALEKFRSCLILLVPLLGKEPPGRRRNLLYKQVQVWMKEAESTKALLATRDIEESTLHASDSFEQCVIQ